MVFGGLQASSAATAPCRLALAIFEELYLTETPLREGERLERPSEILAFVGNDSISLFRFLDHGSLHFLSMRSPGPANP